jgi:transposase-like protein
VLVELKLMEQRYRAVIDVLDGMSVTDVARRNGVSRQTLHIWLRRYAESGMAALADKSSSPRAVRTRWLHSSRPRWSSCAGRIRGGGGARSAPRDGPLARRTAKIRCRPVDEGAWTFSGLPPLECLRVAASSCRSQVR